MKKTLLLLSVSFLVFECAEVKAKCHMYCYFKVDNIYYYINDTYANPFTLDTLLSTEQSINMAVTYSYNRIGSDSGCADHIVSSAWYKNSVLISDSSTFIVTDTGLYQGVFMTYTNLTNHFTFHVGYLETTSVNQINNTSTFTLYPNPFTHNFTLDIKTAKAFALSYQIYDCTGREIKEVNRENIFGELKLTEDFESMSKGVYFLRMKIGEAEFEKKLVRL
jgi:hypothetical protein